MVNSKSTKRALLTSALAILACVAMLIGTTFAWFTDTASTAVNKIQSGTLKISLVNDDGEDLTGKSIRWTQVPAGSKRAEPVNENGLPLWEPGATFRTEWFSIRNDGNLALKYKVNINGFTGDTKLLEVLDFSFLLSGDTVPGGKMVIKSLDEFSKYEGYLLPESERISTDTITTDPQIVSIRITAKMKESAGNEYQGLSLDGIGVTVVAKQYTYEKDSKDDQYDKNATYPEYTVTDAAGFIKAAKEGGIITVDADVDPEDTIVANGTVLIDMNGKTIANTKDVWAGNDWSLVSAQNGADLTISGNGTFQAKKDDCYAVDVQDGSTVTIKDGTFIGNIHAVYVEKGTAIIEGGFYSVQQKYPNPALADEFVLNCYDANREAGTAKIIVKGGTFVNFNPADCKAEGTGTNFVADGYTVVSEVHGSDTWYTVVAA